MCIGTTVNVAEGATLHIDAVSASKLATLNNSGTLDLTTTSSAIYYDNTASGLAAETVKAAIDENAVSLTVIAKYGLKKSGTLTEAVASITISTDSEDKALDLKRATLNLYIPACASSQAALLKINNISSNNYYSTAGAISYAEIGRGNTLYSLQQVNMCLLASAVLIRSLGVHVASDGTTTLSEFTSVLHGQSITSITSIALSIYGASFDFPVGTSYELYGEDV